MNWNFLGLAILAFSPVHAENSFVEIDPTLEQRATLEAAAQVAFSLPAISIARPRIVKEVGSGMFHACGWALSNGLDTGEDFLPFYITYAPGSPLAFGLFGRGGLEEDVIAKCEEHGVTPAPRT